MTTRYFTMCSLFFALLFISSSYAQSSSSKPSSSDEICNLTPYPSYCSSELPQNKSTNINDYCRTSIGTSLSKTRQILSSINSYLKSRNSLSQSTIFALEDCQSLLNTNSEFLTTISDNIKSSNTLQKTLVEDIDTWLSATITNQETCLDGLKITPKIQQDLSPSMSNATKLCGVSLALFKYGWVHKGTKGRVLGEKHLPFLSGRKLLQVSGGGIDANVTKRVTVNPDGSGNFTTINDAINAAPNNTKSGAGYFMIYVVAGVYEEYVSIASNKKYLMIVGDGINRTIITGNHSVDDGWTTFNSATFAVTATGFVAINITIRNTAGAAKHQAVALRSGADLSAFYKCSFEGYQDTLYTHSLRQFYKECDVYGTVDFIFGNAAVVLQSCNLYPRLPLTGQFNAITAQGRTDPNQNTGTSIHGCTIKAADDLASSNGTTKTYLGRPWKQYSLTVYMQSFMDSLIDPTGWSIWSGDFALSTLYYAEYNNTGPGSNTSNRVTWPGYHVIGATDAVNFTVSPFLSGDFWLPSTGVPYTGGLF